MVRQQVVDRAVLPHGHPLAARVVACPERSRRVLADGAPRLLVVVPDVDRGTAAKGGLHPLAVAIVHEGGDHAPVLLHLGQAVLGVVRQVIGVAADDPFALVAIGIVPVALHTADVGDGVLVAALGCHLGLIVAVHLPA